MEEIKQETQEIMKEKPGQVEQDQHRSNMIRRQLESYGYLITNRGDLLLMDQYDLVTYREAITGPESKKWIKAIKYEMYSMYTHHVWTLVEPHVGVNPIRCKRVFKKKTDMYGKLHTYKTRLVAKTYKKIHGVDCDEIFSPIAMFKPIWILLSIVTYHNLEI